MFYHHALAERVRQDILAMAAHFHDANPLLPGINKEELHSPKWGHAELFDGAVAALLREKKLEVDGELLRLPGRGVVLRDDGSEDRRRRSSRPSPRRACRFPR